MPEQSSDWVALRRRAVGERIRTARRHRELTQEQLAHLINVDRRTIHRYETAQRDPALSMLILIADALNISLSALVEGSNELDMRGARADERPSL
ncbi:helix-turn-helix domain-containing protein [Streptomyces sp. NBC_00198]|uniref:helix-turn-helix domain-containing protein n=1 Tax=Streptomyces sp. NBC_00198 TaxID=2975677 RepID=UPI002259175A|nr:helix-turn-helix transcriptional regulator [Streptomyces sp. NBC_00198]MCX5285707.1 helix-turn-helix domain-containing protein [Streptomyces sp. NBC_00198]MCX5286191.1 helix-turn-helix domain-containing protein [Streptomyces sp. NBC_00198]